MNTDHPFGTAPGVSEPKLTISAPHTKTGNRRIKIEISFFMVDLLACRAGTVPARLISLRTRGFRSPAVPGGALRQKAFPNRVRKGRFACLLVPDNAQAGHSDRHPSAARHQ